MYIESELGKEILLLWRKMSILPKNGREGVFINITFPNSPSLRLSLQILSRLILNYTETSTSLEMDVIFSVKI